MKIKKWIWVGLGLVLSGVGGVVADDAALNMRVVWSENPQTEAVIIWDSTEPLVDTELFYGPVSCVGKETEYSNREKVSKEGLYTEFISKKSQKNMKKRGGTYEPSDLFYHQVKLKNLTPETLYYFSVKMDGQWSREYHFKSAPSRNAPFKLIFAGDSRTHVDVARAMNRKIRDWVASDDSIIALLHGADYAAEPRRDMWGDWLSAYALTTTEDGKILPIIPTVGNHEQPSNCPLFQEAYGSPGGLGSYYLCRLSPSVGLIVLNTEKSNDEGQSEFLKKTFTDLAKENVKWQLAAYHRPIFPAIKKPAHTKEIWVSLFESFNLDLALESDGHCIKRTVPIRGEKEVAGGVVYLGEGGYGAPQRDPKMDRWYLQGERAFASKGDHIMILEFTPSAINYSTVLLSGEIVDTASFSPHR